MVLLGYEDPVLMPTMDVYNTDLMKAYIAGAKEQYDTAKADMKEFMKLYQDFYSPIAGDTQNYYNLTIGGANKLIDDIMSKGGDPYKNPEARNMIAKYVASRPIGLLNAMKQSAKAAEEYLKNKADLQQKGLWNPEYEKYLLGGKSLETWDTSKDGAWTRMSPAAYLDLFDTTNPWFKDMKDSYLYTKDGYDYTGVTKDQMRPILDQSMFDFLNTDLGKYHYSTFKDTYKTIKPDANDQEVMSAFKDDILSKNERVIRSTRDLNKLTEMATKHSYDVKMENLKYNHDMSVASQKNNNNNNDKQGFSPLLNAASAAMLNNLGTYANEGAGINSLKKAVNEKIKKVTKNGKYINKDLVDALSSEYWAGNFSQFLGRKAYDNDFNSVFYTEDDANRLHTASGILTGAYGTNNKGEKYTNFDKKYTKDAAISAGNKKLTNTGKIIPILYKDGTIKVYSEVRLQGAGKPYYYDLGLTYKADANGIALDEDRSQRSIVGDYNSAVKGTSLGLNEKAQSPNLY